MYTFSAFAIIPMTFMIVSALFFLPSQEYRPLPFSTKQTGQKSQVRTKRQHLKKPSKHAIHTPTTKKHKVSSTKTSQKPKMKKALPKSYRKGFQAGFQAATVKSAKRMLKAGIPPKTIAVWLHISKTKVLQLAAK